MSTNEFLEKLGFKTRLEETSETSAESASDLMDTLERKFAATHEIEPEVKDAE